MTSGIRYMGAGTDCCWVAEGLTFTITSSTLTFTLTTSSSTSSTITISSSRIIITSNSRMWAGGGGCLGSGDEVVVQQQLAGF